MIKEEILEDKTEEILEDKTEENLEDKTEENLELAEKKSIQNKHTKNDDKASKKGIIQGLKILWTFMGKKEKITFCSIFVFSIFSAFCMLFQDIIPSLVLAQLVGEKVKFLFVDFTGLSTIPLVFILCCAQIVFWVIGMINYYLVDVFARKMICVVNIKAQEMLLLERKNLDYGWTNGEVNYIVKNATDCIYQILEPFCWSVVTRLIAVALMSITLFSIDYLVGICNIVVIALILLCVFIRIKIQNPIVDKIESTNAKIGNQFLTSIQNLPLITMQKSKSEEERHLSILNRRFFRHHKNRAKVGFWYWITILLIEFIGLASAVSIFVVRNDSQTVISSIAMIFTLSFSVQGYVEQWGFQICDILNASIKLCNLKQINADESKLKLLGKEFDEELNNCHIQKIDIKNLNVKIGKFEGIYNASFESGKVYQLSGRSGKGKTTFINALCGLREVDKGEIIVNDNFHLTSLFDYSQKISYMFQDSILFDRSIKENITYPYNEINEETNRLISLFGMEKIVEREYDEGNTSKTLSGGEKKRIDFIRAISKEADVYIFDEPTNELDKANVEKLLNEINALKAKNKIAIIISHDKRVFSIADEIIEF